MSLLRVQRMLSVTPAWLLGFFLPSARLVPIPVPGVREAISSSWASTPWLMKAMKKSKPLELAIDKVSLPLRRKLDARGKNQARILGVFDKLFTSTVVNHYIPKQFEKVVGLKKRKRRWCATRGAGKTNRKAA